MDAPTILSVTAAAAAFLKKPVQDAAGKVIFDGYETLKNLLKSKSDDSPDVVDALEKLESKPDSKARLELLSEELSGCEIEKDPAIVRAAKALFATLPPSSVSSNMQVSIKQVGKGHKAQVAGGDIINTERHTKVVKFTPDERHISGEQGQRLKQLIEKLATTLSREDGKPNFAEAYSRLYKKFRIGTYHQLEKEQFEAAVAYLQQQCAINRPKLRRKNPQAYLNNLYTPIWAKMRELGWQKPDVYAFAQQKLDLKKPIESLTQLGPNQLRSLYGYIIRQ